MAKPYKNWYFVEDLEGNKVEKVDFKDRSPENQAPEWRNLSKAGNPYYRIRIERPGVYVGYDNKFWEEEEPAGDDWG